MSGGNQLRNCWSQAVLTGPCGGAIYQINRGEEAISSAPDDGTSAAQAGLHMSGSDQVSASERQSRASKMEGNVCVTRENAEEGSGKRGRGEGGALTRDTRYQNQLSIGTRCRGYCVVTRVFRPLQFSRIRQTSVSSRRDRCPDSPPSSVHNFRGALSRRDGENGET